MSASARNLAGGLSLEAVHFALAFDRIGPADQQAVARLIDLLTDERTRQVVETFLLASQELDDVCEAVPGLRATQ